MKTLGKFIFEKYMLSFLGLLVASMGYVYCFLMNPDFVEHFKNYIELKEKHEIDEAVFIWIFVLLVFVVFNFIELLKKRLFLQKKNVYVSMLYSTNHIIKNLLYQIQIMRMEAEKDPNFDKQVIRMFDSSIEEAKDMVDKLSKIKNIDSKDIYD